MISTKEYTLIVLEQEIHKNNTKVAAQMVKKAGIKALIFQKDWIVILAILSKMRKSTEMKRLLFYIVKEVKNQYTLITAKGLLELQLRRPTIQ
jgi:hypothetical protein